MPRLAWFSPLPPQQSASARRSADLLPLLAREHAIDVFAPRAAPPPPGAAAVYDCGDFERRQDAAPYDLTIYQLGAAPEDDAFWPCLLRHPGLVVLSDDHFNAARARLLRAEGQHDAWRAELAWAHPAAAPVARHADESGLPDGLARLWPMRRAALDAARAVLVHHAWLAARLQEAAPALPVCAVEPGVADLPATAADRAAVRARHDVPQDAVVFAAAGPLTRTSRLSRVLRTLAALPENAPPWRLLLLGAAADGEELLAEARALGVDPRVRLTGATTDEQLAAHLAAADVGLALEWPPYRTVSDAWLHWLAAGKPTLVTDLAHASDVPALDPRDWMVAGRGAARDAAGRAVEPVAVAIDILDEDHSLGLAVTRLAADAALRAEVGRAARRLWATRFTVERMAEGYAQAIADACRTPYDAGRRAGWPPHLAAFRPERINSGA